MRINPESQLINSSQKSFIEKYKALVIKAAIAFVILIQLAIVYKMLL